MMASSFLPEETEVGSWASKVRAGLGAGLVGAGVDDDLSPTGTGNVSRSGGGGGQGHLRGPAPSSHHEVTSDSSYMSPHLIGVMNVMGLPPDLPLNSPDHHHQQQQHHHHQQQQQHQQHRHHHHHHHHHHPGNHQLEHHPLLSPLHAGNGPAAAPSHHFYEGNVLRDTSPSFAPFRTFSAPGGTGGRGVGDHSQPPQSQHVPRAHHVRDDIQLVGAEETIKDGVLGSFPCVQLTHLAPGMDLREVAECFAGLGPIIDILLDDERSEALVLFGGLSDYHAALQMGFSRELLLGGHYVDILPATRPHFYSLAAKMCSEPVPREKGREREPLPWLGLPMPMLSEGVDSPLVPSPPGNIFGGSVVGVGAEASIVEQPAEALEHLQVQPPLGGGGVEAVTSSPKPVDGAPRAGGSAGGVIRMRGLPYRASKGDVAGFFKGCYLADEGVSFVTRADGRVTGEAYVCFATKEDAKQAMKKDREMMGNRYIELFTSSLEEMARYCSKRQI
jgi:hypothetical protein